MKLQYESPRRGRPEAAAVDAKDVWFPVGLIVAGLVMYGAGMVWKTDARVAGFATGIVAVAAALETVVGIVAAYVTWSISGIGFGELKTAALKLAGILLFTGALAFLISFGWIVAFPVYLGLLVWLFELDIREAILFAVVLWVVRLVVGFGVSAAFG